MQDRGQAYESNVGVPTVEDRVVDAPLGTTYTTDRPYGYRPYAGTAVGEDVPVVRNRVQWGPILAGLATAIGTLVILTVLGIAVGASVLDRNDPAEEIGTGAAVWGAASLVVAFFLGGLVAAKSAAVAGPGTGMLNGLMVGFAGLVVVLWLTAFGLGNLFGVIGANLQDIADVIQGTGTGTGDVQSQASQAGEQLRASFDEVRDAAWLTLACIILPLAASAFGGWLAHNTRRDLIEGTG
jgi:hypothetical protein